MRGIRIVLFVLVWASCSWFGSWEYNPNSATRLFAAVSLVEDGDAIIDDFADLTIDKAQFGGHFYLDKAPGMTLMALPAVALANAATGERSATMAKISGLVDITRFLRLRLRLAVATGPALLTAIAAVMLVDLGLSMTGSAAAGLFAALGFALGTPAWGWSTTIFGHAPVAALFVIATWGAMRSSRRGALLTGVALGWAVGVEYQAALAGCVIALWAVWRWRGKPRPAWLIACAMLGAVVALMPVGAYNQIAFGTPWRVGYSGVVGWQGMQQGLFGLGVPKPVVLREIVLGLRRGMIWVAPILVLAPLGLVACWDRRGQRDLVVMIASVTLIVLLVNAAYVYWDGGNSTGPRLAIPLVGVLAIGLAPAWTALPRGARIGAAMLLALSIALNAAIAAADIFAPPQFAFPIWGDVLAGRFASGEIVSIGSDYLGLSPWAGFVAWAMAATAAIGWLAWRAGGVYPVADRVTGASGSPQGSAG